MKLTKKQHEINENIAKDILAFLEQKYIWMDVTMLFNNKAWSSHTSFKGIKGVLKHSYINEFDEVCGVYEYTNIDASQWEYSNPETVTLLIDGICYEWFNDFGRTEEFEKLLNKYNAYYEMGTACLLSIYFNE